MGNAMQQEAEFDIDVFEAMASGNYEEPEIEDSIEDDDEHQEDTDQEVVEEDEEELDEAGDGELDEDLEDDDDVEEEDSLVDADDLDEEDDDAEDETEDDEEDTDEVDETEDDVKDEDIEETEDDTDTEETSDGEAPATDVVDYKAFYDAVVNTEFAVNGKKVKGFSDPKKIIQSQQMAGGFSEKMAGFKQYRPYMAPLKERGMLEDPAKFDLAMNLLDGDVEAIKAHLTTLKIDPLDLDMEEVKYERKVSTASESTMAVEDALEQARTAGVEDRLRDVIGKKWDPASFEEFSTNASVRNDLIQHISSGAYDQVENKMNELSRLDYSGSYGTMSTVDRYRAAVKALQAEAPAPVAVAPVAPAKTITKSADKAKAAKAKIIKARKEAEYKAKAAKEETKRNKQRELASSVSGKKKGKTKARAKFDPMALEGEEFQAHFDFLASGGR